MLYICFTVRSSYFQGKPMGAVNTSTTGSYTRQPAAVSLFVNSVDFPILMDAKTDQHEKIKSQPISLASHLFWAGYKYSMWLC